MELFIEFAKTILPSIVSLVAVIVSGVAISNARRTEITSTYFTELTKSYRDYLDSVTRFVFHPCDETRDNVASSLYMVGLFSSDEVFDAAQAVYVEIIEWNRNGRESALPVDKMVNDLGNLMRKHLKTFDQR